jgi:hypothetical protein
MKLKNKYNVLKADQIKKVEKHYNAKYVMDACLRNRDGGWVNFPAAIFYTENAHPEGSNYFALYINDDGLRITNGESAVKDVSFTGFVYNEEVWYSSYRHDYVGVDGKFIDGGRDYTRCGGDDIKFIKFNVEKGVVKFPDLA